MVIQRVPQHDYELSVLQDRPIEGQFYKYNLDNVTVSSQTELQIDKIVRTRYNDSIKQHLFKWKGYNATSNSLGKATNFKKISGSMLRNIAVRQFRLLFPGQTQ